MKPNLPTKADITKMTDAEIDEFKRQRAAARSKELHKQAPKMRRMLEDYATKTFNFSLDEILGVLGAPSTTKNGMAKNGVAKTYRNPATGETWTYPSRGRMPKWVRGR